VARHRRLPFRRPRRADPDQTRVEALQWLGEV
jgi:hypothetical protein